MLGGDCLNSFLYQTGWLPCCYCKRSFFPASSPSCGIRSWDATGLEQWLSMPPRSREFDKMKASAMSQIKEGVGSQIELLGGQASGSKVLQLAPLHTGLGYLADDCAHQQNLAEQVSISYKDGTKKKIETSSTYIERSGSSKNMLCATAAGGLLAVSRCIGDIVW
jgi:hypothetical protein